MPANLNLKRTLLGLVLLISMPVILSYDSTKAQEHAKSASAAKAVYVCPPCGAPCDTLTFDKPGTCPKCGMTLVLQTADMTQSQARKKVGILIFDGVQIIDFTGPYEVFGAANFDVLTVARSEQPVTTAMGLIVTPKFTFADAPPLDILVIPGGAVREAAKDSSTIEWVKKTSGQASHTMSVCNGAFILAQTGLLNGLSATTTSGNIGRLRSNYPKIKVVSDQRYVDNGKIITTGGLSAGIDGAMHVVARMLGKGVAQKVALGEEYDWHPHPEFVRAALADLLIPDFESEIDATGKWTIDSTQGSVDHWLMVLHGTCSLGPHKLLEKIGQVLVSKGGWARLESDAETLKAPAASTRWRFLGSDGLNWTGTLNITETPGNQLLASLSINREDAARQGSRETSTN